VSYQGCIPGAARPQMTDARQMSRTLLLSRQAEIAIKARTRNPGRQCQMQPWRPRAGELDSAALFFLRARGIPEAEARALLVEGFLSEVLEAIESEPLRACVARLYPDWLTNSLGRDFACQ